MTLLYAKSMLKTDNWKGRELHFVGVGGAGMSGLALVAQQLGATVTGSDMAAGSAYHEKLIEAGIEPVIGHSEDNVSPSADVVLSTAIADSNPEVRISREREQCILHRADLLGELTRLKPTVAVSGTHGKSTTTSMLVHVLDHCKLDPAFVVGAEVCGRATNAHWSDGDWLIVEADESDRSLLKLSAQIALVTNCELDHHTTYSSLADLEATFKQFLSQAQIAVIGEDVAFDPQQVQIRDGQTWFEFAGQNVMIPLPGVHNAANAAAALTVAEIMGIETAHAARSLASFQGTKRRFERLGHTRSGATVIDDYAHHPTAVRATLEAARTMFDGRLITVFQPHLFSRTAEQSTEFAQALALADNIVVTAIYPSREHQADYPEVSSRLITDALVSEGRADVKSLDDFESAAQWLDGELKDDDTVIFIGAGNIDELARKVVV